MAAYSWAASRPHSHVSSKAYLRVGLLAALLGEQDVVVGVGG